MAIVNRYESPSLINQMALASYAIGQGEYQRQQDALAMQAAQMQQRSQFERNARQMDLMRMNQQGQMFAAEQQAQIARDQQRFQQQQAMDQQQGQRQLAYLDRQYELMGNARQQGLETDLQGRMAADNLDRFGNVARQFAGFNEQMYSPNQMGGAAGGVGGGLMAEVAGRQEMGNAPLSPIGRQKFRDLQGKLQAIQKQQGQIPATESARLMGQWLQEFDQSGLQAHIQPQPTPEEQFAQSTYRDGDGALYGLDRSGAWRKLQDPPQPPDMEKQPLSAENFPDINTWTYRNGGYGKLRDRARQEIMAERASSDDMRTEVDPSEINRRIRQLHAEEEAFYLGDGGMDAAQQQGPPPQVIPVPQQQIGGPMVSVIPAMANNYSAGAPAQEPAPFGEWQGVQQAEQPLEQSPLPSASEDRYVPTELKSFQKKTTLTEDPGRPGVFREYPIITPANTEDRARLKPGDTYSTGIGLLKKASDGMIENAGVSATGNSPWGNERVDEFAGYAGRFKHPSSEQNIEFDPKQFDKWIDLEAPDRFGSGLYVSEEDWQKNLARHKVRGTREGRRLVHVPVATEEQASKLPPGTPYAVAGTGEEAGFWQRGTSPELRVVPMPSPTTGAQQIQSTSLTPQQAQEAQRAIAFPKSPEEAQMLPPGTLFMDADGMYYRTPPAK